MKRTNCMLHEVRWCVYVFLPS